MKNYITIIAVFLLALGLCLIGLYNGIIPKKKRHINEYAYIVELDSATTEMHLDRIIDGWYIDEKDPFKNLRYRSDLRYLPYFIQMYNDCYLPKYRARMYKDDFAELSISHDQTLFKIFDKLVESDNQKNSKSDVEGFEYRYDFDSTGVYRNYEYLDNEFLSIDSLRVRVVAHNDRSALQKLESYYTQRNESNELAIYYKVMLNYEGNGDLAEKFYYTLRPYIDDEHRYFNGIRTVLLRAAICDHNARAQELCDSLGFSLCDYRLPLPE